MSMSKVIFCIIARGCLLWSVCSLGKTLLASALLHFVLQGQACLLFQVCLDFLLFSFQSLIDEKDIIFFCFGISSWRFVGFHKTIQLQLLWHSWLWHRLGLLWYWMVCLEMNRDHPVVFEIAPKYCTWVCSPWDCTQGLFCWLWGLLHFF